ncbi:ABC transporter substrate-binding protein [Nocardioides sp. SR21]|uniref:ABC transporter substrate-binding protein n=1 Tax=Nocardioides sp. SR21 TaxID=2919501 RepID=UPI001FA9AF57|nr:ABC transporter substrate-binding protein [Nocardioides sp. SR21]
MLDLTRRAVVAGGGTAVALAGVPALAATTTPLSIGVLTPANTSRPGSGQALLDGLTAGFAAAGRKVALTERPIAFGFAGAADAATELAAGGAQVVVASVSTLSAREVAAACAEAGVGLVVANVGAQVVDEPLAGAVQASLQHWQSSLRMGEWAAGHLGHRLFAIVAAPDAGYDTVYAVRRGFTSAGGRFEGLALTHGADSGTVEQAARAAKRSGADVVAISATGRRAEQILRACRAAGLRAEIVLDSLAVDALGRAARGTYSVASWAGRTDAFEMLGRDAALLVAEGEKRLAGRGWDRLGDALAGRTVNGLVVDKRLRTVSKPLVVRRATSSVATRPAVRGVPASMRTIDPDRVAGYVNEYLAT